MQASASVKNEKQQSHNSSGSVGASISGTEVCGAGNKGSWSSTTHSSSSFPSNRSNISQRSLKEGRRSESVSQHKEVMSDSTLLKCVPELLFGIFYAVNKADQFLSEYAWNDDLSEYEVENVTELMDAASENDLDTMQKEIDGGADLNAKDSDDSMAIHYAVYNDSYEAAELLAQSGSNLDAKDFYGDTPLMIAAMNGNFEIVELLIKNGANKEIKGEEGYTAYEYAEENGDKEIMKLLAE